jgi:peroxiredoxin
MARLALGDRGPGFALPGVDGRDHSLAEHAGKPVVVVFSCCHCPYVVAWEDRLNAIARDYSGRAALLAVNANDHLGDTVEHMEARAREKGFAFPFLRDASQDVARAYGAQRTPEVFLLDAEHRLAYHGAPDSDYTDETGADPWLRRALDAVLAGEAPPLTETAPVGCTIKWAA